MTYTPTTDFLALIRNSGGQAIFTEMPGLDFVVSALARAGLFSLYVGQVAPIANQLTTVWYRPSVPSWVAEGNVFLYNGSTQAYELATPALWSSFLSGLFGVYQAVTGLTAAVGLNTSMLAITRAAPAATALSLPSVRTRGRLALQIVDWSSAVTLHQITLAPATGETIMRLGTLLLISTADQLAGVTLYPSIDLNGWVIAP